MKSKKNSGPDEIQVELLKLLDNESIFVLKIFCNQVLVYQSGVLLVDWKMFIFIALPKKITQAVVATSD